MLSDEDIKEFKIEAEELLASAEKSLLAIDNGENFNDQYNSIFRAFHSIKGGAGMLSLEALQKHMHQAENDLQSCKAVNAMTKNQCSYFLKSIDVSRDLLDGKNTTFNLTFPKDELNPNSPEAIRGSLNISEKDVLYAIDDEPDILDIIDETLSQIGFTVQKFSNANDLIAALKTKKPQAILSDIKMPEIDGLALLKKIRGFDKETPFIFISGYIDKDLLLESMSQGIDAVLEKPFRNHDLIQTILNVVKKQKVLHLLNSSINLIMYQFSDLDDFLKKSGKEQIRITLHNELQQLLEARNQLKALKTLKAEAAS